MAACWTRVVIALAALLASFCSSHASTPAPSEQPPVACLRHDCTFPIVQAHTNACYVAPADSCQMNQSYTKPLSLSYGKDMYILYLHRYQDNMYCAYNLGPTSECKITELVVTSMDMGPRALNCTHSYNTPNPVCCQCNDHVSIKHSGTEYCLADSECPVEKIEGNCRIRVHGNRGDLIVSYRTDAEMTGGGFTIYVMKDIGVVHGSNCAQSEELDFEVKDMPHLYRCPLLTHDQLVAHVARFAYEVEQNITRARGKDPFLPPQPQCYCYGTCTAKSAIHLMELMNRFASQPETFPYVSYINSPDPSLRQMARAASECKLQPAGVTGSCGLPPVDPGCCAFQGGHT